MSAELLMTRVGPLTTIQDAGRFGQTGLGVTASGPMDRGSFERAASLLETVGRAGLEITSTGIGLRMVSGACRVGLAGGRFGLRHNGRPIDWPGLVALSAGDELDISPGAEGNFGYIRFDQELDVPLVLGSQATNSRVGLGGLEGRALRAGDRLNFAGPGQVPSPERFALVPGDVIRVIWGIHADLFASTVRSRFVEESLVVSGRMDRMGMVLEDRAGIFAGVASLSLVSEPIVAGDIQVLGDGTPIVLMRDHQPTGGYPRIATVISADLDRLAQMRPGTAVRFAPVTVEHAHALGRNGGRG